MRVQFKNHHHHHHPD
ncbi:MAG TPA: his operon leader peptide [Franconibacter helveticus]|uniref:his operon leader peptide n=1 Tax=Franconibacter daqui TaxID=2047724 RepID=A0ABV1PQD2_9ENTR|nr:MULTISPECIES: his operon leader peptide [Franconibacter]MCK1970255.1 his operon leader peptide [Franconibacter sp. IITDAS19]MDU6923502.1 his operon leader peptide [Franconibacter helveticus]MEB5924057.1 his operon leader peptide [Franconibacter daqui]HAZ55595.1 his operon leader peptide [Franconibacter helveticus]HBI09388.1 his operon leader peptide [Franconibacter pulveris]